jgi:hypothetical protein
MRPVGLADKRFALRETRGFCAFFPKYIETRCGS